jgi:hypothetical protein
MNHPILTSIHSYKQTLPLVIIFLLLLPLSTFAEIRYVSKTGSSTPPYTSWETAADSIQKAINICNDGDTVIVANGIYYESLIINASITLLGTSMDSTVIDGRGLNNVTIRILNHSSIKGFNIIGKVLNDDINVSVIVDGNFHININISNCRISNAYRAIAIARQSGTMEGIIMKDIKLGVYTFCMSDTCNPKLYNSVFIIHKNGREAWFSYDGGQPTIENNIFVHEGFNHPVGMPVADGIDYAFRGHKKLILKNNLFSGFKFNRLLNTATDTVVLTNNIFTDQGETTSTFWVLYGLRSSDKLRNNIIMNNNNVIEALSQPDMDYNLFWNNNQIINSPYQLGANDIIADPMLMKDTLGFTFQADYHLQKFSPAIDAGDPEIFDIDGTRSDIGLYGGPLGKSYKYIDLPPAAPVNFITAYDSTNRRIILSWKMNSERDFMKYKVYRSEDSNFIPDSSNLYAEPTVAFFIDSLLSSYNRLYYRVTAVDSQFNESISGQLISVIVTGVSNAQFEVITDYVLYQNFPNPFNSSTRIHYGLKESGNVKLMVYTLTGELAVTIVNGYREAGFYQTDIDLSFLSSGIYLYRIEIIGKGGIPIFMDMKKMLMIK